MRSASSYPPEAHQSHSPVTLPGIGKVGREVTAADTAPPLRDVFNCSLDWFVHARTHEPLRHNPAECSPRHIYTVIEDEKPTVPAGVTLREVCLRSHHSWFELDGFLAVHYIDGHALDGLDTPTGRYALDYV